MGLSCAVLLGGCSFSKGYPSKNYFYLTAERNSDPVKQGDHILRVSRLEVAEAFSEKGFVYRISDVEYKSDYYAQFFTAPDQAISELLTRWLANSGHYHEVIHHGSKLSAGRVLEGTIDELYGDFRDVTAPQAVVLLQIRLVDDEGMQPVILFSSKHVRRIAVDSSQPEDLVRGWNQGLVGILEDIEQELIRIGRD